MTSKSILAEEERRYWQQAAIFEKLYRKLDPLLDRFGEPIVLGPGDFSIYGDYVGHPQIKVSVCNLKMLQPTVVAAMQRVMRQFPGWEIVVAVTVCEHPEWPNMGLRIRADDIVDELQRQYFPEEFRQFVYNRSSQPGQR